MSVVDGNLQCSMRRKPIFVRPNKWMLMIGQSTQTRQTIYIFLDTVRESTWGKTTRSNVPSIDRCSTTRYIAISRHRPHENTRCARVHQARSLLWFSMATLPLFLSLPCPQPTVTKLSVLHHPIQSHHTYHEYLVRVSVVVNFFLEFLWNDCTKERERILEFSRGKGLHLSESENFEPWYNVV